MCKKISFAVMLALGLCVILAATTSAQAPNTLLYQGRLTTAAGAAISNDTATVMFGIFAAASGGAALWQASYVCSTDVNGVFTKELGPILLSVFDGSKRYMGLKVRADAEMTPRQVLTSAPYSYQATNTPGIASGNTYNTRTLPVDGTDFVLDSAVIIVPAAGYVVTLASATFRPQHTNGTRDLARFSISQNSTTLNILTSSMITAPANDETDSDRPMPMAFHRVDYVTAGTYRYYFVADHFSGTCTVAAATITAMYFPTSYGVVGKAPELPPAGFIPDPSVSDGGLSKATSQGQ